MRNGTICILTAVLVAVSLPAFTQDAPNAYKSLLPGEATRAEVYGVLGEPSESMGSGGDPRYPVEGKPGLSDRVFFSRDVLEGVTAASPDPRYPDRTTILARFGEPEVHIRFQTQAVLEYCERGLRFVCDKTGETTGVVYFKPRERRVPASMPNRFDLRRDESSENAPPAPEDFRVGTAEASIAPVRFDNLTADAAEKPFHLEEDVLTRVAIFQRGDTPIVFIGMDVFLIGPWDLGPMCASLAEKGFPNVLAAMSHTHANVDTMGFYGYYPGEYVEHIVRVTEETALKAAANMQPIDSLRRGAVEMPLAGGRVVDLILNWRDPAIMEPTVSLVQAIGKDGKPLVNLVHLTCHPEVVKLERERGISPDFVGALCREVSRKLGGQTVFLNGALGGMVSPDAPDREYATAVDMGKRLSEVVVQAANAAKPMTSYDVWFHRRPIEMPITTPALAAFMSNTPKPYPFEDGKVSSEMNVAWVGDAQFLSVPGELLPQLAIEMMAHMKGSLRMVLGLTNDEFGYIIPSFDYHEGEYEERTGPGREAGELVRAVGLELAPMQPGS